MWKKRQLTLEIDSDLEEEQAACHSYPSEAIEQPLVEPLEDIGHVRASESVSCTSSG
jgi:hypothetical protein